MRGLTLVVIAMTSAVAYAQETPAGTKLFEEGRDLAKQSRWAEACDKFEKSYALDNGVGTELNLADCQEHLGHYAAAWRMFDEASHRLSSEPARQKFAHERAEALVEKLATAVVKIGDPIAAGTSVTIAGRAVKPAAEITEKVDPGSVVVHVVIPGKPTFENTQSAAAGATVIFEVGAPATATTTTTETPPPAVTTSVERRRHSRVVAAYAIGGLGVVAFGTSIGLATKAKSDWDKAIAGCTNNVCDVPHFNAAHDAGHLADIGTVVGTVGLAAIVTGAIVFFTAPKDFVVTASANGQSGGVAISGTF
jgi:hypothetical protein